MFKFFKLVSCFFIVSCENDINDVKSLGKYKAGIDVGKEVIITFSTNGKISAKLSAPVLNQYLQDSGKMVEFPKSIHVDFYKDSFRLDSKLNADYAKYLQTQDVSESIKFANTMSSIVVMRRGVATP